jgi:hypothetical protein
VLAATRDIGHVWDISAVGRFDEVVSQCVRGGFGLGSWGRGSLGGRCKASGEEDEK